ncbi:BamA/TamA family outer membrane protein [Celeribacter halophilus]|uniref:BamA/TamA family outer membrane protein n=1 Tax=Celeribacter halophilus TaxID=576117 RepID=UPI003A923959
MLPRSCVNSAYVKGLLRGGLMSGAVLASSLGAAAQSGEGNSRIYTKVVVRGAEFIPEEDIKLTCGAVPNVPYLTIELRAIEDCLMSTGVFESVTLTPEDDTLVIAVEELNTQPGRIEASLAYSSQDGLIGGLSFEQYNLFPGTYGSVRLAYNDEVKRGIARLYHVDMIEDVLDLGLRAGWEELSYDDTPYTEKTRQLEAYAVWNAKPDTRLEVGLGYRSYGLFDVSADASPLLLSEETSTIDAPFMRFGLDHSSISKGETSWGAWNYQFGVDQYFWNLGTEDALRDFRLKTRSYVPFGSSTRMLISLDAGTVSGTNGNATRVMDRFTPGADSFRGFASGGVGPRDNGDALGGNNFAVSTIELQRNFDNFDSKPLIGGVFWQTGAAWGLDDTQSGTIDDDYHQRSSVGVSLSLEIGIVPISLYVAKALKKEDGDEEQVFGLSLSTNF